MVDSVKPRYFAGASDGARRAWQSKLTTAALSLFLVRLRQNQRPVHLVLRRRRIDRGNAHTGRTREQHIGTMRTRDAPAGKRLGKRVIPRPDAFRRGLAVVTRSFQPLHKE